MELKIMEWNIRGAAALPWGNKYEIKPEIVDKVMTQDAHIIVLTEFCIAKGWDYFQQRLEEKEYVWFMNYTSGKNGVLICVKSELIRKGELKKEIYENNAVSCVNEDCNLLQVSFSIREGDKRRKVTVVGFRMEVELDDKKQLRAKYDRERIVFDKVLIDVIKKCLPNGDIIIVCGDFNNARCWGKLNEKFNPKDYFDPKERVERAQCNYNLNYIKDVFDGMGFAMADVDSQGRPIPTYNGFVPDDHIFVRGLSRKQCAAVPAGGLSEHDIIVAEVDTEMKTGS